MGRYAQARRRGSTQAVCPVVGEAGIAQGVIDTGQVFWEIDLFEGLPPDWYVGVYQGHSALGPWTLAAIFPVTEQSGVGVLDQAEGVFLRFVATQGEDGSGCQGLPTIVEAT